jgi:hypothetical protein
MKTKKLKSFILLLIFGGFMSTAQAQEVDRTELPIKGPWYPPIKTLDARDAKAPPVFEVKAPKDAPKRSDYPFRRPWIWWNKCHR